MANVCGFQVRIKGDNRMELAKYLTANYDQNSCDEKKHFYRIYNADIYEEKDYIDVVGSCAWSVYSCMFDGDHTYHKDRNYKYGTCMTEATKELGVTVEIFSEECGLEFMEHFIVDKGNILLEECVEWRELYDENDEPIYDEETGEPKTEGGIPWEFTI